MPQEPLSAVVDYLRKVCTRQELHNLADGDLLKRFVATREEGAFAVLVHRHGPMVLGICKRVLGDFHDAEDAFQAAFMVLARQAGSLRLSAPLSHWLYGVAQRVARKASVKATARQSRQRELRDMATPQPLDDQTWQELRPALDEEISRLPQKYRAAIVLCYFAGKSLDQAAKELGCPKSSFATRVERARELLRQRLVKRGLALSTGALATALTEKTAGAAVGAMLTVNTAKAAASFAASKAVAGTLLSAHALALAEEVLQGMIVMKAKLVVVVLACAFSVGGVGLAGYQLVSRLAAPGFGEAAIPPITLAQPFPKIKPEKQVPAIAFDIDGDPLPLGAIARLGQDRWLQGASAGFTAFLPDGKSVVTVCNDRTIRIIEFPSGKEIRRIDGPPLPFSKIPTTPPMVAMSPDGKTLALWTKGKGAPDFHLLDLASSTKLPVLKLPETGGGDAVFLPDGEHLATLSVDGTVRIWNWSNGKEIRKLVPRVSGSGTTPSTSLSLKLVPPDGKVLITGRKVGGDMVVSLWDWATGVETSADSDQWSDGFPPHYSHDGKMMALLGKKDSAVTVVEVATGKIISKVSGEETGGPSSVVFSKDGSRLYTLWRPIKPPIRDVVLMEWDRATGKVLRKGTTGNNALTSAVPLVVSPDGNTLACGGRGPQFFDLTEGKEITPIDFRVYEVGAVRFLPDSKSVLTLTSPDGFGGLAVQKKWEAHTGKDFGPVGIASRLDYTVFSPDGKLIAGLEVDPKDPNGDKKDAPAKLIIMDAVSGKTLGELTVQAWRFSLYMGFSHDGKTLALCDYTAKTISLLMVPTAKLLHTLNVNSFIDPPLFSPDGKILATCTFDGLTIDLWDIRTGQRIGSLPQDQGQEYVAYEPAFTADGRCLVVRARDRGMTFFFELATGQVRSKFGKPPPDLPKAVNGIQTRYGPKAFRVGEGLALSADGKFLARAGYGDSVCLWDILTGQKLAEFKGHTAVVNAIAFSFDGKSLASAGGVSALTWDVSAYKRPALPYTALSAADLEACWEALGDNDAAKAFAKMRDLVAAPKDTVVLLKARLKPTAAPDIKRVEELIEQLNDKSFKVRAGATDELLKLGDVIAAALDKALAANPPLETQQRLEELRGKVTGMLLQGERLRAFRAIEVLELIGTPEARQVLQVLAAGAPGALVTVSAEAALKR